ncbi:hypothetical protein EMPS_08823 [Entomortierella parvispora]|uniref:Uncharacterized protein n=1 Tax=Entomortierella parvispora TaxID=205924 RepID=A0A9P3LZN7_9FUNG|nr:hypothetical protein EMPS_08823 [Entomortierella parvispora]
MPETTTTKPAAHKSTSAAAAHSEAATTRSEATTRSTTRATRITTTGTHTIAAASTTTTTHTPTPTPEPAGGPSGAMIGGIVGGVVVIVALVGLVFYKRRQRAAVAAAGKGGRDMMEVGSGPGAGGQKAISGPMALAPENGIDAGPTHRPEAQFREQQQFRPGMRDELFATPGSALHTSQSNKSKGSNQGNNYMQGPGPVSREIQDEKHNNSHGVPRDQNNNTVNNNPAINNNNNGNGNGNGNSNGFQNDSKQEITDDYYDDLDFYSEEPESIGAQLDAPPPRDLHHDDLTPAPEYYLGKEDIDPRRDLRGLDNPDTYISKNRHNSDYPHDPRQPGGGPPAQTGGMTQEPLSPRSSYSSDGEAYLTIEQAQNAHNRKIQGHKESIGSVQMLIEHSAARSPTSANTNAHQDPMHSSAISESTVSVMPSLPSAVSPLPFTIHGSNQSQTSSPKSNGSPPSGANGSNRPTAPPTPAPAMHEDPYAESAFSEDFYDDRSLVSGSGYNRSPAGGPQYNNGPGYRPHPQAPPPLRIQQNNGPYPPGPGSRGSPYSPQAMSPPYYSPQGYNGNHGPRDQHPGTPPYGGGRPSPTSHGYTPPGPGYGPPQYPPHNGGHHGNPGPGYRPQPAQRDPSYNNNQGPYRGQY